MEEEDLSLATCPHCGRKLFTAEEVKNYNTVCPACKAKLKINIVDKVVTVKQIKKQTSLQLNQEA